MKRIVFILITFFLLFSNSNAEKLVTLKIGPLWPRDIYENHERGKRTAWDFAFEWGKIFDNRFMLGGSLNFTWYTPEAKDTVYEIDSTDITQINAEEKMFMFPLSMFLGFDPVPHLLIHPVIKGKFGCNLGGKKHKRYPASGVVNYKDNGFYIGFYGSASINAVYDMGESVSVFTGFEYQWSKIRKKLNSSVLNNEFIYKKMHGPGIRMGLRFIF